MTRLNLLFSAFILIVHICQSESVEKINGESNFRIEQITGRILSELGMRARPVNISSEERARAQEMYESSRIMEMYENGDNKELDTPGNLPEARMFATKFRVYAAECNQPEKPTVPLCSADMYHLHFDIAPKPGYETHVKTAWLKLYLKGLSGCNSDSEKLKLRVYQQLNTSQCHRELASLYISRSQQGWIKLNVSGALRDWLNVDKTNLGLVVTLENSYGEKENVHAVIGRYRCENGELVPKQKNRPHSTLHSTPPSIELSMVQSPKLSLRQKRSARNGRQKCKRVPIYLSFSDIGWSDWVLQPQGFETGFCSGSCGKIGWRIDIGRNNTDGFTPRYECCAPSRMKSIKILHFDETRKLCLSVLKDFLVSECDCASGSG